MRAIRTNHILSPVSSRIAPLHALAALATLTGTRLSGPALAAGEPLVVYAARKYRRLDALHLVGFPREGGG
jgi:hypothetical protein